MAEHTDGAIHDNKFLIALAKHLGLDPSQLDALSCTYSGFNEPVEVQWDGRDIIAVEDFNKILDETNQNDVIVKGNSVEFGSGWDEAL